MFLRGARPHHILNRVRIVSKIIPSKIHKKPAKQILTASSKPIPTRLPKPNKLKRFQVTGEVLISKIFPAGFCWQGASIVAEQLNFATNSTAFALTTGMGDALGVMAGHFLFYSLAKSTYRPQTNLREEAQTGLLLGTAAFGSGAIWQPMVNICHSMDLGLYSSLGITGFVCGATFFTGLRLGRSVYSRILNSIKPPTQDNRIQDVQLSSSIGGATGAFVGTDISFGSQWLTQQFGITELMSEFQGMVTAGKSTTAGFAAVQTVQNILSKRNWTDN